MNLLIKQANKAFNQRWSEPPGVISIAPGRVNVIGEHTDYTGGYVLPITIDKYIVVAASRATGSEISAYSGNMNEAASCRSGHYSQKHPKKWFHYIMGVLSELERIGYSVPNINLWIASDIPVGAGLSSSAALETAILIVVEGLFNFKMKDTEAALLCQRAENDFVGVKCGIMDQYISRMGRRNHALLINCSDLSSSAVRINLPKYSWIIIDSGKRRELLNSEYNQRRRECEEALEMARSQLPDRSIPNLRSVTVADLTVLGKECSDTVYRRLKHVVTENERVLKMVSALLAGDVKTIGRLLCASHQSLRDDFEVSCDDIERLVAIVSEVEGVCGVRLTGAGFGGSVIVLVHDNALPRLAETVKNTYHFPEGSGETAAEVMPIKIPNGAQLIG